MASRPVTSQDDIRIAPGQLMRPGERTGDSGMKAKVAMVAAAACSWTRGGKAPARSDAA